MEKKKDNVICTRCGDIMEYKEDEVECPYCYGSGYMLMDADQVTVICSNCNGTGEMEIADYICETCEMGDDDY